MKCLVTGATGFIGVHLCRHLAEAGWEVLALVRPGSDWSGLRGQERVSIVYGSVRSRNWLPALANPDCCLHLAGDWVRLNADDDAERRQILRALGGSCLDEHAEWILMHRDRSIDQSDIWRPGG